MSICAYCGGEESMPFTCKFCGLLYCGNHHLPENHECIGLEKFKEARSKKPEKWIYEPFHERYKKEPGRAREKPIVEKIREAIFGLSSEKILYIILLIIAVILIFEFIKTIL